MPKNRVFGLVGVLLIALSSLNCSDSVRASSESEEVLDPVVDDPHAVAARGIEEVLGQLSVLLGEIKVLLSYQTSNFSEGIVNQGPLDYYYRFAEEGFIKITNSSLGVVVEATEKGLGVGEIHNSSEGYDLLLFRTRNVEVTHVASDEILDFGKGLVYRVIKGRFSVESRPEFQRALAGTNDVGDHPDWKFRLVMVPDGESWRLDFPDSGWPTIDFAPWGKKYNTGLVLRRVQNLQRTYSF